MRVALISTSLPPEGKGGAEAYVAELAAALVKDNDVIVLTGVSPPPESPYRVAQIPCLPHLPHEASFSDKMIWHARDQWRPTTFLAALKTLRGFQPDVVHTNECQGLSAAVFTAVERLGIPHVHMAHDLNLLCARVTMTRDGQFCGGRCGMCKIQRVIRGGAVARDTDRLVSVSRYIERHHVAAGVVPPERSRVVRLGVRAQRRTRPKPRRKTFNVGFLGSVSRHKGILTLLRAFALAAGPDWRLLVAGEGACVADVARAAAFDGRVSYLGHVGGQRKTAFFDAIDVLAVPSEWEEPACLSAVEGAAHGIPLVVSDRGGLRELPEACLFPSGDANALASQLQALQQDVDKSIAISTRLLERHAEFAWDRHFSEMHAVLREVANGT